MTLDKICSEQNCDHYIEWEHFYDIEEQPYPCFSCQLDGQSYNITEIAEGCPHRQKLLEAIEKESICKL